MVLVRRFCQGKSRIRVARKQGGHGDSQTTIRANVLQWKRFFSITRDQTTRVRAPLLVFMGQDMSHPAEISRQICRLCPSAELVPIWRNAGPHALEGAKFKVEADP